TILPNEMASTDIPTLLLHPVRFRLVQTMLDRRERTPAMLAEEVPDVSRATVYRQIALLAKAGLFKPLHHERRRGAVEITYGIDAAAARFNPSDVAQMSRAQIERLFVTFWTNVLANATPALRDPNVGIDDLRFFTLGFKADADSFAQLRARLLELFSECDEASADGAFRTASIVMHPGTKQLTAPRSTRYPKGTPQ
ncbi:MAG: helix-turn-helix domain-containing protein, partial [Vulcanimicrobiaceae bacterium]